MPCANWWIKADGVDIISSLEESVRGEWNGDADIGDGACQKLHEEYVERLHTVVNLKPFCSDEDRIPSGLVKLGEIQKDINRDIQFIDECE